MKHPTKLTTILIIFFIVSQVLGLYIISQNIDFKKSDETGKPEFKQLPAGMERPEVEENYSWVYILLGVLIGTGILLLLIRFKLVSFWKFWFFLAIFMCLTVAFATFTNGLIAAVLAIILTYFKIIKPNTYVHNLTELFIYAGLAVIFVPILNTISVIILLILISLYDMYAVWKSKHMIKLAKFQTQSKVFAGFSIPYNTKKGKLVKILHKKLKTTKKIEKKSVGGSNISHAILGGGDIAFPLLFAGAILKSTIITNFWPAFLKILIIPICAAIGLSLLFYKTKKNRFYPAMPFISIGCFIGYGLFLLL